MAMDAEGKEVLGGKATDGPVAAGQDVEPSRNTVVDVECGRKMPLRTVRPQIYRFQLLNREHVEIKRA
jgi:hypothetical protein